MDKELSALFEKLSDEDKALVLEIAAALARKVLGHFDRPKKGQGRAPHARA